MPVRTTRQFIEVLGPGTGKPRVSRQFVEVLGSRTQGTIHLSRQFAEVLGPGSGKACITRQVIEVLGSSGAEQMSIASEYYGTVAEAAEYFALRLHETAWTGAAVADRPKALWAATQIIDTLNFKGYKHTVFELLEADEDATQEEIREAEAAQVLEFPRGEDTEVPQAIRRACYEIAHSLLDGKDPEMELENLGIVSQGYSSVRTTYSRNQVPIEHLINLVPSASAWNLLRPFLRDDQRIKLTRVS